MNIFNIITSVLPTVFLILYGMVPAPFQQASEGTSYCKVETRSTCSGYTTSNCTMTCRFIPLEGGPFGYYKCILADGSWIVNEQQHELASFPLIADSIDGFCKEGPEQNWIYCVNVYQCNTGCTVNNVNAFCGPVWNSSGAGALVLPKAVDHELPCGYCD